MIDLLRAKLTVNLLTMVGLIGLTMALHAQVPTSTTDADQIEVLMSALSNRSKTPADVLNPNLPQAERDKDLSRFSAPNYELSIVPEGIPAITGDSATVPVRVRFDDKQGNMLNASGTAHFIRVGDTWYFSNFDFMKWPLFLIGVLVVGILIGIGYAATVLVLLHRLIRQGQLGANAVKVFLPIFWPPLFRTAH